MTHRQEGISKDSTSIAKISNDSTRTGRNIKGNQTDRKEFHRMANRGKKNPKAITTRTDMKENLKIANRMQDL